MKKKTKKSFRLGKSKIKKGGANYKILNNTNVIIEPKNTIKKKLAIIVPYKNRKQHLDILSQYLTHYLKDIDYKLFVIEQDNENLFNRGRLINIGFDIAKNDYDYFALHDVDHLPLDADYSYVNIPTHLSSLSSQFNYKIVYDTYFSGVVLVNKEDFIKLNGYGNNFFGWGGEDDDLYFRVMKKFGKRGRRNGKFLSLPHEYVGRKKNPKYNKITELLNNKESRLQNDGLNSLKYKINNQHNDKKNYTLIKVDWDN